MTKEKCFEVLLCVVEISPHQSIDVENLYFASSWNYRDVTEKCSIYKMPNECFEHLP